MTLYEKALEVSWWMLCLGRYRGQNPWGLPPLGAWPWDLPRHNIHHDTSSAFSNNVPVYDRLSTIKAYNGYQPCHRVLWIIPAATITFSVITLETAGIWTVNLRIGRWGLLGKSDSENVEKSDMTISCKLHRLAQGLSRLWSKGGACPQ